MYEPDAIPTDMLDPISRVVDKVRRVVPEVESTKFMLVGAYCRDLIHAALGYTSRTRRTNDLDLALGLRSWSSYDKIAREFRKVGDTGIRFHIAGIDVDVLPFGPVEDPVGTVVPPSRGESLSVWAFEEIHTAALPRPLPGSAAIMLPSVPGYAAAKLMAWLDRSAYGEYKDAPDLALVLQWYTESAQIEERLYVGDGVVVQAEGFDLTLASAHQLGIDIRVLIGPRRLAELLQRWPGNLRLLVAEFQSSSIPG